MPRGLQVRVLSLAPYLDKRIKQSDIERDNYLQSLGWKVVRIKWSDYQKLSTEDRKKVIASIRASLA